MFKVITPGFSQTCDRWIDALETGKSLIPKCKWFSDIRILEDGELVWVYSRSHKFPQFVGPGTYDRLAEKFLIETSEVEIDSNQEDSRSGDTMVKQVVKQVVKQIEMGAVHTQVTITNSADEEMVNRGILAPRHLRQYQGQALVDTGAVMLVIPQNVAEQLGLRIRGQQLARFANGSEELVGVTESIIVECEGRKTADEALVVGDEILIGQVILEKLDLLPDCKNQRLIPNPANPDYPVAIIKRFKQ
ncbi:retroviral-like aspartic protease family protein [Phormidesmis priestleyi]